MNIAKFQTIAKANDNVLFEALTRILKEKYKKVCAKPGEYIYAPGNIPIGLVAHIDTVHTIKPHEFFYDNKKKVLWSSDGLGADDRAGIYAILEILEAGYKPTIIITDKEEAGGKGARTFVQDFPIAPKKLNYLIELDRQGYNDSVYYWCENEEFENHINSFGFTTQYGTFSDISIICPSWGLAGVNLSIGYMDEHTYAERLYTEWFDETVKKVKTILENPGQKFKYIEKYSYSTSYFHDGCAKCGNPIYSNDYINYVDKNSEVKRICWDCISAKHQELFWCDECGIAFEGDVCPICKK